MEWTIHFLLLTLISRDATAYSCCPDDNVIVLHERRCSNHEEQLSFFNYSLNCTGEHFHMSGPNDFTVRPDDSILLGAGEDVKLLIPAGKYCIASILYENETSPSDYQVAIVCSPEEYSSLELSLEMTLYAVCVMLSAIMLLVTFVVYLLVPQLRDLQGKCLLCTVLCLFFAYFNFGLILLQVVDLPHAYCAYLALFTYFWMLASFFWMNVVSFNSWRNAVFRRFPVTDKHLLVIYNSFGWGVPLVFVSVATVFHHLPNEEEEEFESTCWIDGPVNLMFYFALPVVVLICLNTLYFIWTGCRLWRGTDQSQSAHKIRSLRYKCVLYLKLFLIMGITWVIRVIFIFFPNSMVSRIAINMAVFLQGFFIFLILVLFRKRALRGLVARFHCNCCPQTWTTGEDHEDSEEMLPEEVELSQTTP